MKNINIDKEGFTSTRYSTDNSIDYLYYLTFNNRATIVNSPRNKINYETNVYDYFNDYHTNKNEEIKDDTTFYFEMVSSLSSEFNRVMAIKYGVEKWKEIYQSKIIEILEAEFKDIANFTTFFHDYDKSGYRLHNHIYIYPFTNTQEINKLNGKEILSPMNLIDKNILINVKRKLNDFAKTEFNKIDEADYEIINKIESKYQETKKHTKMIDELVGDYISNNFNINSDNDNIEYKDVDIKSFKEICRKKKYIEIVNEVENINNKAIEMFNNKCSLFYLDKESKSNTDLTPIFDKLIRNKDNIDKLTFFSNHIDKLKEESKEEKFDLGKSNEVFLILNLLKNIIHITDKDNYQKIINKLHILYIEIFELLKKQKSGNEEILISFFKKDYFDNEVGRLHNMFINRSIEIVENNDTSKIKVYAEDEFSNDKGNKNDR